MNWLIVVIVAIAVIALVIYLVRRNLKDEKSFENKLDNDFGVPRVPKDQEGETAT